MTTHGNGVRDNKALSRFELDVEGAIGVRELPADPAGGHHHAHRDPAALRGRGIASELVEGALELIRADGHKVIAGCGFVADYLRQASGIPGCG